jgi:hypothetical protein
MGWVLYGERSVDFEERILGDFLIGDELIRVQHLFDYADFPGIGHALISNVFANGERDFFRRSYPYKDSSRIYEVKVPAVLVDQGYGLHQLLIRRNVRARVQANANWRVRVDLWVPDTPP